MVNSSLDVAYPITYYVDATAYEDATPVPVHGGDRLQIDFHLNPVPALHVLYSAPNGGNGSIQVPELRKRSFDGMASQNVNWQQVSEGVFELTGVPAGGYVLRTSASPSGPGLAVGEVELNKDGQELDLSAGEALASVKTTLQIPGENLVAALAAGVPGRTQPMVVTLFDSQRRPAAAQAVNDKGEVSFENLAPGKYTVWINSSQRRYSVVGISSSSGAISGHTLTVSPGARLDVTLRLVGSTATIDGFAKRSGQPVAGAMIVLIPSHPEADRELFRRDQSDLDGSFTLRGVIPGAYTLVAIENAWDLDWAQPSVIGRYLPHGQPLTVPADKQGRIRLADALEVQPR